MTPPHLNNIPLCQHPSRPLKRLQTGAHAAEPAATTAAAAAPAPGAAAAAKSVAAALAPAAAEPAAAAAKPGCNENDSVKYNQALGIASIFIVGAVSFGGFLLPSLMRRAGKGARVCVVAASATGTGARACPAAWLLA